VIVCSLFGCYFVVLAHSEYDDDDDGDGMIDGDGRLHF